MSTTETDTPAWQLAGEAWGHAPLDWAYGFEPYGRDAIEHLFTELDVGPDTHLLDMACGSGCALGRAERLGAAVSGLDASAALIEIAHRRAPGADLRVGDMFDLPWPADRFDVLTSINGVWGGCGDALIEAARVLRPGGRIGLTFWGPGHALDLRDWFIALGTTLPSTGEEMLAMADINEPGVVEEMLGTAGFVDVERCGVPAILELPDEETAWRVLRSPGLLVPALEAVGDEELRSRLMAAVAPFRAADGSYRLVNELTAVTATLPS